MVAPNPPVSTPPSPPQNQISYQLNMNDFANREDAGILLVPKAGEMLYHLKNPPSWAMPS